MTPGTGDQATIHLIIIHRIIAHRLEVGQSRNTPLNGHQQPVLPSHGHRSPGRHRLDLCHGQHQDQHQDQCRDGSPMQKIILLVALVFFVNSCANQSTQTSYDMNSWKSVIPDSCLSFFDGCNNCRRAEAGKIAACTRKYCETYSKPVCLDNKNP